MLFPNIQYELNMQQQKQNVWTRISTNCNQQYYEKLYYTCTVKNVLQKLYNKNTL